MIKEHIIEKIDLLWHAYWLKQSDGLFNHATDTFMESITDIPYCKLVLNKLKEEYPFQSEQIKHYNSVEYWNLLERHNNIEIYSFLYQWYEEEKNSANLKSYYKTCRWLGVNEGSSRIDMMQMFKTDVIRPIVDYIISSLNDKEYILYLLDRYRQRVELFENIKNEIKSIGQNTEEQISKDIVGSMNLNESVLQKDLCLYLFDCGVNVHREEMLGNGRLDVLINHDKNSFVIEIKYIKATENEYACKERIENSITQIEEYMSRTGATSGYVLVYTEVDVIFVSSQQKSSDIQIETIYIGDKTPSQRKRKTIEIII